MDLIFNELSFYHKPKNNYQAINILVNFAEACSIARKNGFKKVRVEYNFKSLIYFEDYNIYSFLSKITKTHSSFLRKFIQKPNIAEGIESEDEIFINNDYFLNEEITGELKNEKVTGLAYAYLYNSIAVSLCTSEIWNKSQIKIREKNNKTDNIVNIKHICKLDHFENHIEWIENQQPIILVKSKIKPENKKIKLAGDHHGNDKLFKKAKQLVKSPYVFRIVNSIYYSPSEQNFIKQCFPNGEVEVVLTKEEAGYGMKVLTTGRNLKETELIAQKLWDKYYK